MAGCRSRVGSPTCRAARVRHRGHPSEGRGTTKPFEFVGAPWIGDVEATALAEELNARGLPGVTFRPMFATSSFSWHAGELSGGVQVHVTDAHAFESVRTGVHVLDALRDFDETE